MSVSSNGSKKAAGGVDLPEESLKEVAESVGAGHPLGRPITAEDCAEVAAFLASDRASNLTGVLVPVDVLPHDLTGDYLLTFRRDA